MEFTSFGPMLDEGPDATSGGAWEGLAATVGCGAEEGGVEVAGRINRAADPQRFAPSLYSALSHLLFFPGHTEAGAAAELARLSDLIVALQPAILGETLLGGSNPADRRRLIRQAIQTLRADAVFAIAVAAGAAYERPVSSVLSALLKGLEQESTTLPTALRAQADRSFRSLVQQIVERWAASRVDSIATGFDDLFPEIELKPRPAMAPEPERVVQLALETGAVGSVLWDAVTAMSEGLQLRRLLGMLRSAPSDSRAAQMIAQQFANPQRLAMLLREEEPDFDVVDALLKYMGTNAADTMLDALSSSHSRAVRRGILDRLAALGPAVGPFVIQRLKDDRWFVQRNMLHVLREARADVSGINLVGYQSHSDARVRREATELLLRDPLSRDRALAMAFKDSDPYLIRTALRTARGGFPEVAVPLLAKRIMDEDFPPEFRVPSIQLLSRSKSVLALDALLRWVQGGTTLLGKPKLAAKSPEMLAALKGLTRSWSTDRRAKVMLELAAGSKDGQIAAAAESPAVVGARVFEQELDVA